MFSSLNEDRFKFKCVTLLMFRIARCSSSLTHGTSALALYVCMYVFCFVCMHVCLEELLVPALPEKADIERGYVTPQQVYNLLNAEAGEPALHDPYYILILDCRSADKYHSLHTRP